MKKDKFDFKNEFGGILVKGKIKLNIYIKKRGEIRNTLRGFVDAIKAIGSSSDDWKKAIGLHLLQRRVGRVGPTSACDKCFSHPGKSATARFYFSFLRSLNRWSRSCHVAHFFFQRLDSWVHQYPICYAALEYYLLLMNLFTEKCAVMWGPPSLYCLISCFPITWAHFFNG